MTRFVYRPNDPRSNKNGMLDASIAISKMITSGVHVIRDEMDPTRHMADGKYYTSKSEFRKATKAAGCVEAGNEVATLLKPRKPKPMSREQRRNDIRRALRQLQGY